MAEPYRNHVLFHERDGQLVCQRCQMAFGTCTGAVVEQPPAPAPRARRWFAVLFLAACALAGSVAGVVVGVVGVE